MSNTTKSIGIGPVRYWTVLMLPAIGFALFRSFDLPPWAYLVACFVWGFVASMLLTPYRRAAK